MKNHVSQIFPPTFLVLFPQEKLCVSVSKLFLVIAVYKKKLACLFKVRHCIRNESFYCITLHIWWAWSECV